MARRSLSRLAGSDPYSEFVFKSRATPSDTDIIGAIQDQRMAGDAFALRGDLNTAEAISRFPSLPSPGTDTKQQLADLALKYDRDAFYDEQEGVIGRGAFGKVYDSDTPGYVIKEQGTDVDEIKSFLNPEGEAAYEAGGLDYLSLGPEAEVNAMEAARGLHMAPEVRSLEYTPEGKARIEMRDLRPNYESAHQSPRKSQEIDLAMNKQLAALALRGTDLHDRHSGNYMVHKMTGRPIQLDFGITSNFKDKAEQVRAIGAHVDNAFQAAEMRDVATIFKDTVIGLLNEGKVDDALDVAKQGLSRVQKIKKPFQVGEMDVFEPDIFEEDFDYFNRHNPSSRPDGVSISVPF